MKALTFRVLLDNIKGVFREIEIPESFSLEQLHQAIIDSLNFSGMEMASFFISDENWEKGDEISLMDMSEPGSDPVRLMSETAVLEVAPKKGDRLLHVYDFLNMWISYVELVDITEKEIDKAEVVLSVGDSPAENSLMADMEELSFDDSEIFDDILDEDDETEFESLDDHPEL